VLHDGREAEAREIFLTRPPQQQMDQVLGYMRDRMTGRDNAQSRDSARSREQPREQPGPVGALIGRIDNPARAGQASSRAFLIGTQTSVVMPSEGELLLGVNDSNHDDNNGVFTVRVSRRGDR
jgi:hypothetical protein